MPTSIMADKSLKLQSPMLVLRLGRRLIIIWQAVAILGVVSHGQAVVLPKVMRSGMSLAPREPPPQEEIAGAPNDTLTVNLNLTMWGIRKAMSEVTLRASSVTNLTPEMSKIWEGGEGGVPTVKGTAAVLEKGWTSPVATERMTPVIGHCGGSLGSTGR